MQGCVVCVDMWRAEGAQQAAAGVHVATSRSRLPPSDALPVKHLQHPKQELEFVLSKARASLDSPFLRSRSAMCHS